MWAPGQLNVCCLLPPVWNSLRCLVFCGRSPQCRHWTVPGPQLTPGNTTYNWLAVRLETVDCYTLSTVIFFTHFGCKSILLHLGHQNAIARHLMSHLGQGKQQQFSPCPAISSPFRLVGMIFPLINTCWLFQDIFLHLMCLEWLPEGFGP